MKSTRAHILNILFFTFLTWLSSSTPTQADITATPKAITINATRGEVVTRTIALRTSENASNVTAIALDALSADDSVVMPATTIQITAPPAQIGANELVSVPITFNLQTAPSGEFIGEVVLLSAEGETSIPIIVRVKDPWLPPLLTLIVGITIGMAVSAYSSQGKLSDEITVNLENVRTQIEPEQAEARSFWSHANTYLVVAKQARDAKQLTASQAALGQAKTVWDQWLQHRSTWLIQFRYYDSLRQRLEQNDLQAAPTLYVQTIARDLEEALESAPDLTTPEELRERLNQLSQHLNHYIKLTGQLEKLKDLAAVLENDQRYQWEDKAEELTQQMQLLLPTQAPEMQSMQEELTTSIEKVRALGAQFPEITKGIDGSNAPNLVLQAPAVRGMNQPHVSAWVRIAKLWQTANGRLRLFYLSSYLISFIVLAGGGFNQLYWTKPTFGANGWGDYFALLALGFGAEATRNVVTQVANKADESTP